MSDKIFIDSNIFLYSLDKADSQKRNKVKALLTSAAEEHHIFISTQVLNEIFSVATRKLGMDGVSAKEFVRALYDFEIVLLTPDIIEAAMDCSILNRLSYWDALMLAAAEAGRCDTLWTEDMKSGDIIRGVRIINPFMS